MPSSKIKNSKRILSSSIINLLITRIISFVNRTVIIRFLGSDFLGLSGLFGSILQVLSLAELGFSLVIVYYLYEPLTRNDTDKINQVLTWLKKIYHIVGIVIMGCGTLCIPFLPSLIHGNYPDSINIYVLFILMLFNSGISYFLFAYKEALLIADQKKDVITNIRSAVTVFVSLLQFLALLLFRSYYLYVVLLIVGTVSSNLLMSRAVSRRYPYLKHATEKTKIPDSTKKELIGLSINRLSNISRNAFDNIIISSTIGLVATSIYGNYYMIYTVVIGITGIICGSIQAGIGNSIAVKSEKENFENLLDFSFLFSWISGWCSVTMACLYQPFMEIWVGPALMLSDTDMFLFVAYFYLINMNHIRNQYILGNAFWWKLKGAYLAESIGNLVLNMILGNLFGITGVLIATILTIFFCNYLMCNSILFKNYFRKESIWLFYRQQFYYLIVAVLAIAVTYFICMQSQSIIIRAMICVFIPNGIFIALYFPCSRWKSGMKIVKNVLKAN